MKKKKRHWGCSEKKSQRKPITSIQFSVVLWSNRSLKRNHQVLKHDLNTEQLGFFICVLRRSFRIKLTLSPQFGWQTYSSTSQGNTQWRHRLSWDKRDWVDHKTGVAKEYLTNVSCYCRCESLCLKTGTPVTTPKWKKKMKVEYHLNKKR